MNNKKTYKTSKVNNPQHPYKKLSVPNSQYSAPSKEYNPSSSLRSTTKQTINKTRRIAEPKISTEASKQKSVNTSNQYKAPIPRRANSSAEMAKQQINITFTNANVQRNSFTNPANQTQSSNQYRTPSVRQPDERQTVNASGNIRRRTSPIQQSDSRQDAAFQYKTSSARQSNSRQAAQYKTPSARQPDGRQTVNASGNIQRRISPIQQSDSRQAANASRQTFQYKTPSARQPDGRQTVNASGNIWRRTSPIQQSDSRQTANASRQTFQYKTPSTRQPDGRQTVNALKPKPKTPNQRTIASTDNRQIVNTSKQTFKTQISNQHRISSTRQQNINTVSHSLKENRQVYTAPSKRRYSDTAGNKSSLRNSVAGIKPNNEIKSAKAYSVMRHNVGIIEYTNGNKSKRVSKNYLIGNSGREKYSQKSYFNNQKVITKHKDSAKNVDLSKTDFSAKKLSAGQIAGKGQFLWTARLAVGATKDSFEMLMDMASGSKMPENHEQYIQRQADQQQMRIKSVTRPINRGAEYLAGTFGAAFIAAAQGKELPPVQGVVNKRNKKKTYKIDSATGKKTKTGVTKSRQHQDDSITKLSSKTVLADGSSVKSSKAIKQQLFNSKNVEKKTIKDGKGGKTVYRKTDNAHKVKSKRVKTTADGRKIATKTVKRKHKTVIKKASIGKDGKIHTTKVTVNKNTGNITTARRVNGKKTKSVSNINGNKAPTAHPKKGIMDKNNYAKGILPKNKQKPSGLQNVKKNKLTKGEKVKIAAAAVGTTTLKGIVIANKAIRGGARVVKGAKKVKDAEGTGNKMIAGAQVIGGAAARRVGRKIAGRIPIVNKLKQTIQKATAKAAKAIINLIPVNIKVAAVCIALIIVLIVVSLGDDQDVVIYDSFMMSRAMAYDNIVNDIYGSTTQLEEYQAVVQGELWEALQIVQSWDSDEYKSVEYDTCPECGSENYEIWTLQNTGYSWANGKIVYEVCEDCGEKATYCARWVAFVYSIVLGYYSTGGNANEWIKWTCYAYEESWADKYSFLTWFEDLESFYSETQLSSTIMNGMCIVAVDATGNTYGHVGIVFDGFVYENNGGYGLSSISIDSWINKQTSDKGRHVSWGFPTSIESTVRTQLGLSDDDELTYSSVAISLYLSEMGVDGDELDSDETTNAEIDDGADVIE